MPITAVAAPSKESICSTTNERRLGDATAQRLPKPRRPVRNRRLLGYNRPESLPPLIGQSVGKFDITLFRLPYFAPQFGADGSVE
ncbi:hypothetical protein EVAR_47432_1 [Eumeta japonica]|uniref:Uncharacterized protein n=1 Tax=Eumeta variegata TaxID=151549 RepID=A0A4C1Y3P3_EUMVA|nr:hypothetical protein EVAR_47432_1 [Eumeta japonica]